MDKLAPDCIYDEGQINIEKGFVCVGEECDTLIVATGNTVALALNAQSDLARMNIRCSVMDLFCLRPNVSELVTALIKYQYAVAIEEHTISCGMSSLLCEVVNDNEIHLKLKRLAVNNVDGYGEIHGDRSDIEKYYGITKESIVATVVGMKNGN
jgi:transketolase